MRLDALEKISEIQELLEEMELEKVSELEEMLKQFEEKLREEYYSEFLKRYKDLVDTDEDVSESVEILEGLLEDYKDVLNEDLIETLEEIVDDLNYLDEEDIHAKKELLSSYLEELS